jgi:hypothetical protein
MLSRRQTYFISLFTKSPAQEVGSSVGIHTNQADRGFAVKCKKLLAGKLLERYHFTLRT